MDFVTKQIFENLHYNQALKIQNQLNLSFQSGWIVFSPQSVITLGRRIHNQYADHIYATEDTLIQNSCEILPVTRGGLATYHGPGQLVIFPYGNLRLHTGNSRGVKEFIQNTIKNLMQFIVDETQNRVELMSDYQGKLSGIWKIENSKNLKIVSIGLAFSKFGLEHGFSLNLWPDQKGTEWGFKQITPCGEKTATIGYLYDNKPTKQVVQIAEQLLHYLK